jgi:hypothetical protein
MQALNANIVANPKTKNTGILILFQGLLHIPCRQTYETGIAEVPVTTLNKYIIRSFWSTA